LSQFCSCSFPYNSRQRIPLFVRYRIRRRARNSWGSLRRGHKAVETAPEMMNRAVGRGGWDSGTRRSARAFASAHSRAAPRLAHTPWLHKNQNVSQSDSQICILFLDWFSTQSVFLVEAQELIAKSLSVFISSKKE